MSGKDRKIIVILLLLGFLTGGAGYMDGDWKKMSSLSHGGANVRQKALDRLFGSDLSFDASADDVTTYTQGASDNVSWKKLALAKGHETHGEMHVSFAKEIQSLDNSDVTITGFMFPLQSAENQSRFLLSAYPPSCPYCLPGGPSEMIEVTGADIPFTYKSITLHGTFHLLQKPEDLQEGMYYRLSAAQAVKS